MRGLLAALAVLGLAACTEGDSVERAASGGYTLEVRATEAEQIYVVTAPDGRVVAGRAAGGASALMQPDAIQALAAAPQSENLPGVVSFSAPGFSVNISGEDNGDQDAAHIAVNAGGQQITVNARDGGAVGDNAFVRITGADEAAARDFIAEADELSPAVQAEMLAGLGLN